MSEGIFLEPRNQPNNGLLRSGPSAAFGLAGASVTAKPGCLYQVSALNTGATAYYLQFHDKATAPIAGETPIWEEKLPANGAFSLPPQLAGLYFALGIGIAISTTPRVLTLAAANDCVVYTRHTTAG